MRSLGGVSALVVSTLLGCAAGRAPTELQVAEQNARRVVEPLRFAWASSETSSAELPSAIALGGATTGRVLLYLEFPELDEPRRLLRAELLLETRGAPGDSVPVELSRSQAPSGKLQRWSDQPRALHPRTAATLVSEGQPARLDVTDIVEARSRPDEPLRLTVWAEPSEGPPVLVVTGASGGLGPRLEAYWD